MAGALDAKEILPYPTLNWLFLWSLTAQATERLAYLPHVQRCAAAANAAFIEDPDTYNSTMVADATLVAALLDDSLKAAAGSDAALDGLVNSYEDALQTALVTPKERDSVVMQIRLMALFHRAYEKRRRVPVAESIGARLDRLADRLSAPSGASVDSAAPETDTAPPDEAPAPKRRAPRKRRTTPAAAKRGAPRRRKAR